MNLTAKIPVLGTVLISRKPVVWGGIAFLRDNTADIFNPRIKGKGLCRMPWFVGNIIRSGINSNAGLTNIHAAQQWGIYEYSRVWSL